jgi:hypothetical protein
MKIDSSGSITYSPTGGSIGNPIMSKAHADSAHDQWWLFGTQVFGSSRFLFGRSSLRNVTFNPSTLSFITLFHVQL